MISFFTLLVGLLTFLYVSNNVENRYRSTSEILVQVSPADGQIDGNTLINSQRLLDTAVDYAKSQHVVEKLKTETYKSLFTTAEHRELIESLSVSQIISGIRVSSSNTSFIIRYSYSHPNADFAVEVTSNLTHILVENEDIEMFKNTFSQLSGASSPVDDSPNKILYMIVGFMGGAIIGVGIAFIRHLMNNSYMTKEQLEQGTGIQVIGVIPEFEMKESRRK